MTRTVVIGKDDISLIVDVLRKELSLAEWRSGLEKHKGTQFSKEQGERAIRIKDLIGKLV